tara:strand:+ start:146 stop:592 length:447 start_codon:yes stop_codon:yes gene_type:complete
MVVVAGTCLTSHPRRLAITATVINAFFILSLELPKPSRFVAKTVELLLGKGVRAGWLREALTDEAGSIKARVCLREQDREGCGRLVPNSLVLDSANNIPDEFKIFLRHSVLLVSVLNNYNRYFLRKQELFYFIFTVLADEMTRRASGW